MAEMNSLVDSVLKKAKQWRDETQKLRELILGFDLAEDLKWGKPCYAFEDKNIVLIQGFKEYVAILFFKGALLKDSKRLLMRVGENTQAGRQLRFTSLPEIAKLSLTIKAYVKEAIEVEKAGLKVPLKGTEEFAVPEEFQRRLDEDSALKTAFRALTPGRQRGYLLYFSGAKQSKTREGRIEKCAPQIFKGEGLND